MRIKLINLPSLANAKTVMSWNLPCVLSTNTIAFVFLANVILAVFATVGWAAQNNGNDNSENRIVHPTRTQAGINPLIVSRWSGRPTGVDVKIKDVTTGQILKDWTGLGDPKLEFRTKDVLGYDLPVGHIIRVRTRPRTTSQTWPVAMVDFKVDYQQTGIWHTIGTEFRSKTSTFLRTNGETLGPTLIAPDDQYGPAVMGFRLSNFGMFPGDVVKIKSDLPYSINIDATAHGTNLAAVFSSTSQILTDQSKRNRVLGAIDAGTDVVTPPTHVGNLQTDIPEDFLVTNEWVVVKIPEGAEYIFLSQIDSFFSDNGSGHVTIRPATIGDYSGDDDIDLVDLDMYSGNIGADATGALAVLDLDGDGTVGANDFQRHYETLVETSNGKTGTLAGDVNLDGVVDVLGDAFILVANLGQSVASRSQGDLNADGVIDVLNDAFILVANLGQSN